MGAFSHQDEKREGDKMMERVEVYSVKDNKAAMGVFIDDIEIACPVIPYDTDVVN